MNIELLKKSNGSIARSEEEKEYMIVEAAKHYGNFLKALKENILHFHQYLII